VGGFTIAEVVIATAILAALMVVVTEVGYHSMRERARIAHRQTALETAGNVLEAARARPWDELTPEWAAKQDLTEETKSALPEGSLTVRVEPVPERPRIRRVTVEVRWQVEEGKPAERVQLVSLFSARSAVKEDRP
jgi:hypothetical protein